MNTVIRLEGGHCITLGLPAGWEPVAEPPEPTLLVALAPQERPGFHANIVVTQDRLRLGMSLDGWQAETEDVMAATMPGYVNVDLERCLSGDYPALRRVSTYIGPERQSVTMAQWCLLADEAGVTVTCTCATRDYHRFADDFDRVGDSLRSLAVEGVL